MSIPQAVIRTRSSIVMATMVAVLVAAFVGILAVPFGPNQFSFAGALPFALSMLALEVIYIGWLLCIGMVSNGAAASSLRRAPWVAVAIFPVAVIYIGWFPSIMFSSEPPPPIVWALHLFSMFVNFFILWFASRSIHASELEGPPTLRDYLPTFLLLWFAMMFPPAVKWTHERVQANVRRNA